MYSLIFTWMEFEMFNFPWFFILYLKFYVVYDWISIYFQKNSTKILYLNKTNIGWIFIQLDRLNYFCLYISIQGGDPSGERNDTLEVGFYGPIKVVSFTFIKILICYSQFVFARRMGVLHSYHLIQCKALS